MGQYLYLTQALAQGGARANPVIDDVIGPVPLIKPVILIAMTIALVLE